MSWRSPAWIVAVSLLCGSAAPAQSDGAWRSVGRDLELEFPRDHGAHPLHRTEWWYVTGQVEDDAGRAFGFQFTIFRRGLGAAPATSATSPRRARHVFAGHLAVADVRAGVTRHAERLRRSGTALATASESDLDLVLEDWSFSRRDDGSLAVFARDPATGIGLDLELEPEKPLALHGDGGYSSKGGAEGNASAYTSWTRIATRGKLWNGGEAHRVTGSAWFDHEFGSSVLDDEAVGWDWFGLQLDDGRELMLFELRRADGTAARAAGSLIESDGGVRPLAREDFTLAVTERWTSPQTGAEYPARWSIELHVEGLRLEIVPRLADAELLTTSTGVAYWEGPVELRGGTTGRGYAELTGYAQPMTRRF